MRRSRLLLGAALAGQALTATAASAQDAVTSLLRPHAAAAATGAAPASPRTGRATPCSGASQAPRQGVGGVASLPLGSSGAGAGEYARFLPQAAAAPATNPPGTPSTSTFTSSATNVPAPSSTNTPARAQRPAPGTSIPSWADRPLYAETVRPLWNTGESAKRNGAETRGRQADPIPPGQRLATGMDRSRLWNPGESPKPGNDDKSGAAAEPQPADPTRAISIDPPLWNDGSSVAGSPSSCGGDGEAAAGSGASRF